MMLEELAFELRLAFLNLFRNRRRTLVTLHAIALSCAGLILYLGYFAQLFVGSELQVVNTEGHLQIHRTGFTERGAGNPSAFAIDDYAGIVRVLESEEIVRERCQLITARLHFTGLAVHHASDSSAPFIGFAVLPEDEYRLSRWNPYGMTTAWDLAINEELFDPTPELSEDDPTGGSLGIGLAAILELEGQGSGDDGIPDDAGAGEASDLDFAFLEDLAWAETEPAGRPEVDLLVLPAGGGIPNVATLEVRRVLNRATKELDDRLLKLHLDYGSDLLFPGEPTKATAIVLLLRSTDDTEGLKRHLQELFAERGLDLEVRTWEEIVPFHTKLAGVFRIMKTFVAVIIAVMIVFTIYNSVTMGIVERTTELGTLRAMGTSKSLLRRLLVGESLLLGALGGVLGVAAGFLLAQLVNASDLVYPLPVSSYYAKIEVFVLREPLVMVWGFATAMATSLVSGLLAARRATRLSIVEALRHV